MSLAVHPTSAFPVPNRQGIQWPAASLSIGLHIAVFALAFWIAVPKVLAPPMASKPKVVSVSLLQQPAPVAEPQEVVPPAPEPPPPPPPPKPEPREVQAPPEPPPEPKPPEPKVEPQPEPVPQPVAEELPVENEVVEQVEALAQAEVAEEGEVAEVEEALVEPDFQANYLRNPAPAYPRISRRLGEQGEVLLRVLVDTQGKPRTVELKNSSGFERLDKAAIDVVQRWSFVPAKRGARTVEAWVIVPIVFNLG